MVRSLLISALIACGPSAGETAAINYAAEMQSLFEENKAINRAFLDVAAKLKRGRMDVHAVAKRFDSQVVPRAVALSERVVTVSPKTDTLSQVHAEITRAWSIRAAAYTALNQAWTDGDLQAYTRALHDNTAVTKAEVRYIAAVNAVLAPHQLQIDPYP
jgi:hypothetical protein